MLPEVFHFSKSKCLVPAAVTATDNLMNTSLDADLMAGKSSYGAAAQKGPPDRRLLRAAAAGDEEAFSRLYHRHAGGVYNYLLRLTDNEPVGEELLQETFVAVWQGAHDFQRRAKVKTWIFRIAHNLAVSWLRRHRPESLEDDADVPSEEDGPETSSVINWQNDQLLAALELLSPNHRAVVELVFVHELPYNEIAQIMDCPVGTVKSRMSYALQHLCRLLINSEQDG